MLLLMIYRRCDMIYGLRRMIYLCCKYDIISVPAYAVGIYHRTKCDIISKIYHPFRQERISLQKSSLSFDKELFCLVREAGLEPARPQ